MLFTSCFSCHLSPACLGLLVGSLMSFPNAVVLLWADTVSIGSWHLSFKPNLKSTALEVSSFFHLVARRFSQSSTSS